jgi:spore maturation protein CgeB
MVMGVGGFLLLDNQPEIDKFFTDGEDLVYYSDIPDFKNKASYYLKNSDIRNKIGENARKKILAQHTYAHRVDYLLDVLSSIGLK